MKIGSYNNLPHYEVIGDKTCFYIWVNEDGRGGASEWIKGQKAFRLYSELALKFKKGRKEFIFQLKQAYQDNL